MLALLLYSEGLSPHQLFPLPFLPRRGRSQVAGEGRGGRWQSQEEKCAARIAGTAPGAPKHAACGQDKFAAGIQLGTLQGKHEC